MIADDPTRFNSDPSPAEIHQRAAEIRARWTPEDFVRRSIHYSGAPIQSVELHGVETAIVSTVDIAMAARE